MYSDVPARWRSIDAAHSDGVDFLDEAVGLEGHGEDQRDVSRTRGCNRGGGAGQHHLTRSTLGVAVPIRMGGLPVPSVRSRMVVGACDWCRGRRDAHRAPGRVHMGPRKSQDSEERT